MLSLLTVDEAQITRLTPQFQMAKEQLMPRGWQNLLFLTVIQEATRLFFGHFVCDTFLGFCEDGRKVTEEVEGTPGA